ncbi:MAG: hypothetical protein AAF170_08345 [Bacteroidota bacterium]
MTRKEALQGQITSRVAETHTVEGATFARFGSTALNTPRPLLSRQLELAPCSIQRG